MMKVVVMVVEIGSRGDDGGDESSIRGRGD